MNFLNPYLNSEELEFYENIKNFSKSRVLPGVEDRDEKALWSRELWKEMGEIGLNGIAIPEEYGGQGGNCMQCCIASEAFSSGASDGGLGLAWGAHTIIGTMPIVLFGTKEQKEKYLPKLATGEWIAGLGLTEPGSGSDAAALLTRARPEGNHFVVNGSKMFITNGPVGKVFICMIRTKEGESRGPLGISAFIIENNFKGFSVGKVLKKLGMHTSTTSELIFDEMRVPEENLLGPLHSGFLRIGKATLEWERTVLVASTSGMEEFVLERSLRYARERKQFGKSIITFPAIREKLAKNWVYLQASRRYIYYVAQAKDRGESLPMQASILKLLATEPGEEIAHEGVQIHGGYGYMREYHMERIYRDVKLGTIGAGSSEVMRSIISSIYPGYDKFIESMQGMNDEETRNSSENVYRDSIAGELEVLYELETLLKEVSATIKKFPGQTENFAFANLILVYSALKQAFWDCNTNSGSYKISDKKRDFALLTYFLISKYFQSFHILQKIIPDGSRRFLIAFLNMKHIDELIHDCVNYLERSDT
ncbi:MAG: acyl-CoA dehydrogenase family protein [Leptospiraceae bacterium]|nr:acyl-CoA dehydrogenase family protein [Leptospiraceae bacterium]MCP5512661.1 acyl-CoA dehydrogenase family protein [Leptospiraceae bacterium]